MSAVLWIVSLSSVQTIGIGKLTLKLSKRLVLVAEAHRWSHAHKQRQRQMRYYLVATYL